MFQIATESVVDQIIERVGSHIVLAIPLGIGKPNTLVNALYQRVKDNSELSLTILTALTLNTPKRESFLEKRFLDPLSDRLFGDYPDLMYESDRRAGKLPVNVTVSEFYFPAGSQLHSRNAQENYICSNYTHVARDLLDRKVNVVAQIVSLSEDGTRLSLSCNPDVSLDLVQELRRRRGEHPSIFVAQINRNLPYMFGDADLPIEAFDLVFENEETSYKLFGPPKTPVSDADHAIGLYASMLVKDGGELQIGIGALGDALINGLLLRQQSNEAYVALAEKLGAKGRFADEVCKLGGLDVLDEGLFAATEMFVDSFMHLIDAGILKRRVYDHVILQRLLNEETITETVTAQTIYELLACHAVSPELTAADFEFLQYFGIFRRDLTFADGIITDLDGTTYVANFNRDVEHERILENCLGSTLTNGAIMHAGFYLGPQAFYDWLRNLPVETKSLIHMKSVTKINQLYGHEELDRLHRKNARFINTCLYMTLFGSAASDGLADGRVISGVGGQYNFVAMAQELPEGHSILQLRSTRVEGGKVSSNIVFSYGHITIPRHLRDVVVTEYGIADIRGKSDAEVAKALLHIADSRFQSSLLKEAKRAGKIEEAYQIPKAFQDNFPHVLARQLADAKTQGLVKSFPFGTDFTDEELQLGRALKWLKRNIKQPKSILPLLWGFLFPKSPTPTASACLERMGIARPANLREQLFRRLILAALARCTKR